MIAFAEIAIGSGDVVRCGRCGCRPERVPRSLSSIAEELRTVASSWSFGTGPNVSFVGFEPFAHPELPPLIAAAAEAGFERIRLRTSGGGLAQPRNAEGALSAGVRHLEVAVLGSPTVHDRLSGVEGAFSAAADGARAFTEAATRAGVDVCVTGHLAACRHNVGSLPEAVAALAELGATAVRIDAAEYGWRDTDTALLRAAIDTATLNRVAAFVAGGTPVGIAIDDAPYTVVGASA